MMNDELDLIFQELAFGRGHLFMNTQDRPGVNDPMCIVCHGLKSAHGERQHPFVADGERLDTAETFRKRPKQGEGDDDTSRRISSSYGMSQAPFDPVLRQALVDKGLLTVADLQAASEKIQMVTQQIVGGGRGV